MRAPMPPTLRRSSWPTGAESRWSTAGAEPIPASAIFCAWRTEPDAGVLPLVLVPTRIVSTTIIFISTWAAALIAAKGGGNRSRSYRSEEHTSELQSLMRISYAVFCLKKKKKIRKQHLHTKVSNTLSQNVINTIRTTIINKKTE